MSLQEFLANPDNFDGKNIKIVVIEQKEGVPIQVTYSGMICDINGTSIEISDHGHRKWHDVKSQQFVSMTRY